MSKTKFNGFENWFITESLKSAIVQAETDVIEARKEGRHLIYAEGYFTMVGEELIAKINSMTLKKDRK